MKSGKVFINIGHKGGVGKTTKAINLAAACASSGASTVLVDLDSQGTASIITTGTNGDGVYRAVYENQYNLELVDRFGSFPFHILKSNNSQLYCDRYEGIQQRIIEIITYLKSRFDVVMIDTQPSITATHLGLFFSADWAIIPAESSRAGCHLLEQTLKHIEDAEKATSQAEVVQVMGIVPTRFNASKRDAREWFGYIKGAYGRTYKVYDPIHDLAIWEQANNAGIPIFEYHGSFLDSRKAKRASGEFEPVMSDVLDIISQEVAV